MTENAAMRFMPTESATPRTRGISASHTTQLRLLSASSQPQVQLTLTMAGGTMRRGRCRAVHSAHSTPPQSAHLLPLFSCTSLPHLPPTQLTPVPQAADTSFSSPHLASPRLASPRLASPQRLSTVNVWRLLRQHQSPSSLHRQYHITMLRRRRRRRRRRRHCDRRHLETNPPGVELDTDPCVGVLDGANVGSIYSKLLEDTR
ncbi:hypothetical protein TcWFU_005855 [Taenia crassiceps]|uniref:Uncharacterized protein n=1 Tax=Taenia crassiceps TaxID=6207 RepID=A0ABR4Q7J0_9CEST